MGLVVNAMGKETTRIHNEIESLRQMTAARHKEKCREVFGEETRSNHKQFLFRRIAWRIQAKAWGGLSERARQRALEIANDADLRIRPPRHTGDEASALDDGRTVIRKVPSNGDSRLPLPGTLLVRDYRGKQITVTVRDNGFAYQGKLYRSLSAVAREVTGTRWNGIAFFGLTAERTRDKISAARRKGKSTGGHPVLGYDIDPRGGRLLLNPPKRSRSGRSSTSTLSTGP